MYLNRKMISRHQSKRQGHEVFGASHQIAGHKDQLSSKGAHIDAVRKAIPELDESVTNVTEIRQKQDAEFMAISPQKC